MKNKGYTLYGLIFIVYLFAVSGFVVLLFNIFSFEMVARLWWLWAILSLLSSTIIGGNVVSTILAASLASVFLMIGRSKRRFANFSIILTLTTLRLLKLPSIGLFILSLLLNLIKFTKGI